MLSRRSLVTSAAALPALTVPAAAASSACTLPPDLIARFVRARAWFLDISAREARHDYDEKVDEYGQTEADRLTDERWSVARAMLDHQPQTIVDLAWQAEAWLLADLEIIQPTGEISHSMLATLFRHIRTLGALAQPDDPFGALVIHAREV